MRRSGFALALRAVRTPTSVLSSARFGLTFDRLASGKSSAYQAHHHEHHLRQSKNVKSKKAPPPSLSAGDLYDAVMYDGAASLSKEISENASLHPLRDEEFQQNQRLDGLAASGDLNACLSLLDEMKTKLIAPSPATITRAMRSCIPLGDAASVEKLGRHLGLCAPGSAKVRALERARPIFGLVSATRRKPEDVLSVMGWTQEAAEDDIERLVESMELRRDAVSWGLVAWSLNRLGKPIETVRLLDAVCLYVGLPLNDSLSHLAIDALGKLGRFEDAKDVFSALRTRQSVPHERTVGSLLHVLTSHQLDKGVSRRRPPPDPNNIRELVSLITEPSERFLSASLRAYAACKLVEDAEEVFQKLCNARVGALPDERVFVALMRLYGTLLIKGVPNSVPDEGALAWADSLAEKADRLWTMYFDHYGHQPPTFMEAHARHKMFTRYILAKGAAGHVQAALQLVTDAASEEGLSERPWFEPTIEHFETLMFGVERECDVHALFSALQIMATANVEVNDSCLGSAILVLVGNGETLRAAKLACVHADTVLSVSSLGEVPTMRRKRLLRRFELLKDALQQLQAQGEKGENEAISMRETSRLQARVKNFISNINMSIQGNDFSDH